MNKSIKRISRIKFISIFVFLMVSTFSYAREYRLIEVVSEFFPGDEKLFLTLELDNAGNISHLKKQEYIHNVMTDEDIFSIDEIKNPKSSSGVLIYAKDGRSVIWLKSSSPTLESHGGTVIITYLHNALAIRAKKRKKSQSYQLRRDKSRQWKLTSISSRKKINVLDFKKNTTLSQVVGVSRINIAR
ncbi:hypothetical protein N9N67_08865 [Bacteriovoracaceae bacterium]|nr:hypothetical protein [Bacteriovoracaceae bacterium]